MDYFIICIVAFLGGTGIVCDVSIINSVQTPNVIITGQLSSDNFSAQSPWSGAILNGAGYFYMGDPGNNNYLPISNSTLESDQFISLFDNSGISFWSTNYGDNARIKNDKNNAITSTKSITNNSDKSIYLTGYSEHPDHEVMTLRTMFKGLLDCCVLVFK